MPIKDRIIELKRVKASELSPHPMNWREHPQEQREAMKGILEEVGYVDALKVRPFEGGYQIIDGHLRAETTPETDVPVLVLDLDDQESAAMLATFDPLTAMAEQDSEKLATLLRELQDTGDTLAAMVWPDYMIEPLLAADWTPPAIEAFPVGNKSDGHTVNFSVEQWETVMSAVNRYRAVNDAESISDGRAIELICAKFIA